MVEESTESTNEGPPRTLLASALLIGAVIMVGIVLSVMALMNEDDTATEPPPAPKTSSQTSAAQGGDKSVCGLKGYEKSGSLGSAPDARWVLVGTIASPRVEGSGPGVIDEKTGFGHCYARTREGALLAAANFLPFTATNELQKQAYDKLLLPGPGRDAAMKAVAKGNAPEVPADQRVQIAGFQLVRYDGDEATVRIAGATQNQYHQTEVVLRWADGDWKVVVNDDGSMVGGSSSIPDLTGFIPWSGA